MKAVGKQADERSLIEAAQKDPARFAELYESNFERVYAFLVQRVGNREEAQDLTAEVFHQALASIHHFQWRATPFVAWLLGIANHLLSHRWQRAAKQQEIPSDGLEQTGIDDKVEQRVMLFQLVSRLPDDQRQVIVRRFVHQRSLREIAQEMGRSEGAIKQLQLRALENLREHMKGDNHE